MTGFESAGASPEEIEAIRRRIEDLAVAPARWNPNPDDVQRSVMRLVLSLVEFLRQLLERQAIRRMEAGALTDAETEAVGIALMRLESSIRDLAARFDIPPESLNLDLGPLGPLL